MSDATCRCADPDLEVLRDLVADGLSQLEASRLLWAPDVPMSNKAAIAVAGLQARRMVRAAYAQAFPWLSPPRGPA